MEPTLPQSSISSDGQGLDDPQGYEGKGTKGKGQGQDFHTLAKPLPLTRVRGFCKGYSRVTFYLKSHFIWLQKLMPGIENFNLHLKTPGRDVPAWLGLKAVSYATQPFCPPSKGF
jgi:hypothetical protein